MTIIRKKEKIINLINNTLWDLPSPRSMTYFWNFGSILGVCLLIQIRTGLFLTFHYTSYALERFSSIIHIIREVWFGWIIRLIHINGASVFFFFIYLHLFRRIYYFRATHKQVWIRGVTILITLIAISFLGYVLPWGQISYWAVAVITNLFSVIPIIGNDLVKWIWGGFSVRAPTLTRFFSFHFILPFLLTFIIILHLAFLHKEGRRNRIGLNRNIDKIQFHPYFTIKDLLFILRSIIISILISIYTPYLLGDPVNNIPANPIQTPIHIQPEWYFLSSYAILRSLPRKTAGVIALALSVSIFYVLPLYKIKFSTKFSSYRNLFFWRILIIFIYIIKMGALPAEEPYVRFRKIGTFMYFILILILNL